MLLPNLEGNSSPLLCYAIFPKSNFFKKGLLFISWTGTVELLERYPIPLALWMLTLIIYIDILLLNHLLQIDRIRFR